MTVKCSIHANHIHLGYDACVQTHNDNALHTYRQCEEGKQTYSHAHTFAIGGNCSRQMIASV